MTGKMINGFKAIRDCTEAIKPLHGKFIGGLSLAPTTGINIPLPMNLSDAVII